jgi:uncharacterized protein
VGGTSTGRLMRNLIPAALVVFLSFAALAAPVAAGPMEDANEANKRGDYGTALRLLRPLAEQGNAKAQYFLGFMYLNGQGVKLDYSEAAKWYWNAAEQGNADSQFILGLIYLNGLGVAKDYLQAHKWFNLAAARSSETDKRNGAVTQRDAVAAMMTPAQIAEAQRLAREWKPK